MALRGNFIWMVETGCWYPDVKTTWTFYIGSSRILRFDFFIKALLVATIFLWNVAHASK
jgi:hypothetical protein